MSSAEAGRHGGRTRRTHSAEFKAQVVAACQVPGVSKAAVAMAHGVNDNLVRRWVVEAGQHGGTAVAPVSRSLPAFVPVRVPGPGSETAVSAGIHIELRRGPVAIKMTWPVSASSECAAWMRELLR